MQLSAKLKNKSLPHSLLLKVRVGTVVSSGGDYYQNTSGINSDVSNTNNWFKISGAGSGGGGYTPFVIDKTATDITGTDPNFKIDLSAAGLLPFPPRLTTYVDLAGDGSFTNLENLSFNPTTAILSGFSSPADYPNQVIKIVY